MILWATNHTPITTGENFRINSMSLKIKAISVQVRRDSKLQTDPSGRQMSDIFEILGDKRTEICR